MKENDTKQRRDDSMTNLRLHRLVRSADRTKAFVRGLAALELEPTWPSTDWEG